MKNMTSCHENHDVLRGFCSSTVMKTMTSLIYHTPADLSGVLDHA